MEHPAVPGGWLGGSSLALLRIEPDRYACARRTAVPLALTMSTDTRFEPGHPVRRRIQSPEFMSLA
jgi:hypothetical protein